MARTPTERLPCGSLVDPDCENGPHAHGTVAAAADPDPLPALVASLAPRPGPLGLGRPLGGERQSSRAGASARHCRDRPCRHPGGRLGRLDRRPGPPH
jgi:hypothetical protein